VELNLSTAVTERVESCTPLLSINLTTTLATKLHVYWHCGFCCRRLSTNHKRHADGRLFHQSVCSTNQRRRWHGAHSVSDFRRLLSLRC